ncbi:hypothetical protein Tco_0455392 [Tanacetum coccineum]
MNEFPKFEAKDGESLDSVYERLSTLVNVMDHNDVRPIKVFINTKFLNSLQPEWIKYVTLTRQDKDLSDDNLLHFEPHIQTSKANKAVKNHDPVALIAHSSQSYVSTSYSHSPQPYYVTHTSSVIDSEEDYQRELQGDAQENQLTTAVIRALKYQQAFSYLVNLLEVKQHVSTSVKEIDYTQLGIVNHAELNLQPRAFFSFCIAA